ncbi:hypothetical protein GV827_06980 [Sulfitobacter sp. JBTF-M27]|uniref:Uncharacterized protein n=1 Tax=Sulfitobacter sediminilitoris TaxID=2698830 RepID=A0A6P0C7N4_9RHOB|nr:hypothetical protein [Sulfitobacter sediminilitoris]NEK22142.1 hypothetical protein [Sulfitobacter sediminilitoris]
MADFDVWYSRPFDVHVWSEHPKVNAVVAQVYDSLSKAQQQSIQGKSYNAGRASGKTHLKVVLLDLYVAWKTDPALCIGIARGNDAYKVNSRYNGLHISPRVKDVVRSLDEQNYIDFRKGSHSRTGSSKGNRTSRMRATKRLTDLFLNLDLEPYELDLHHNKECIVLKYHDVADNGEPTSQRGQKKSKDIEYKDTPETIQMRSELNDYNALLAETYIDIPSLTEPHITRTKTNGDTQVIPIDQNNKFVRRIFSRGSWEMNGRFYGGWWQQVGKDYRKQIAINNFPTVEVDYKGLHVAILSAQKGIQDDPKDRYDLGQQLLPQFNLQEQRAIVKLLVLTAINAKSEESAYGAFRNDQPTGSLQKKLTNTELSLLLNAFTDKHPHLQEDLCSDQGIKLMRIDSEITAKVLNASADLKVPILSVHDSYIISIFDVELLRELMREATKEVVGYALSVEQETLSYEDIIDQHYRETGTGKDGNVELFRETATIDNKTPEYEERILRFINHRKTNYEDTY